MNKTKRTGVLFALLAICAIQTLSAQGISKKRDYSGFFDSYYYRGPLSFTGGLGVSLYKGDVSKGFYGTPGFAFNLGANYKLWPRTMFGVEFNKFSLAGKSDGPIVSSFKGSDWSINLYARYYLIDDIIRLARDRKTNRLVKPYITAGVAFLRYKSVGTLLPSASGFTPVIPLGLGVECKISQRLQVIPEFTHTLTFNDKIDGASIKKGKDGYSMITIKVQYSPFAPKKKKKLVTEPAAPNQHREEHQEWRKKKKEEPKPEEEIPLPGDNSEEQPKEEGTEEVPQEEQPTEEKPSEEQPTEVK